MLAQGFSLGALKVGHLRPVDCAQLFLKFVARGSGGKHAHPRAYTVLHTYCSLHAKTHQQVGVKTHNGFVA